MGTHTSNLLQGIFDKVSSLRYSYPLLQVFHQRIKETRDNEESFSILGFFAACLSWVQFS